jgi:hypothetical protein
MPTFLTLEYPNGRSHDLELGEEVKPGEEIDLYGRRWKVIGPVPRDRGRRSSLASKRLLCRPK